MRLPRSGPSSSTAVMVGTTSWLCTMNRLALGDVAGPGDVRQRCGDRVAVGVQCLREVAGGALGVVLPVLDDPLLDVVLALTRGGATAAGATRGRSTRRARRHHRPRAGRRIWRLGRRRYVDGGLRCHGRCPPDPLEVPRDRRGNETQR